jgi:hypothetical protein
MWWSGQRCSPYVKIQVGGVEMHRITVTLLLIAAIVAPVGSLAAWQDDQHDHQLLQQCKLLPAVICATGVELRSKANSQRCSWACHFDLASMQVIPISPAFVPISAPSVPTSLQSQRIRLQV